MPTKIMLKMIPCVHAHCSPPKYMLCLGAPDKDTSLAGTREIDSID